MKLSDITLLDDSHEPCDLFHPAVRFWQVPSAADVDPEGEMSAAMVARELAREIEVRAAAVAGDAGWELVGVAWTTREEAEAEATKLYEERAADAAQVRSERERAMVDRCLRLDAAARKITWLAADGGTLWWQEIGVRRLPVDADDRDGWVRA